MCETAKGGKATGKNIFELRAHVHKTSFLDIFATSR